MSFIIESEQSSMIKSLIKNFKEFVSVYSPSGNESGFSGLLFNLLKKYGSPKKDKFGNIFIRIDGEGNPLFLLGHMDTVEPGENIKPIIKGDYIVSNGTTILGADNKATIAVIIESLELLKSKKTRHRTVEVIFTRSEEVGNYGAVNFDYSLLTAKAGFCFDSNAPVGTIITASPFYDRFDLQIIGKSAHAADPEKAVNVLFIFNELLNKIKPGKLDDETILNIGIIKAGHVRNTIPGKLDLGGEIRSYSEKKLMNHKKNFIMQLNKIIKKFRAKHKLDFVRENPGYKFYSTSINPSTSLRASRLIEVVKEKMFISGIKSKVTSTWGVSDANVFNQNGLTCINLGDGVENAHTVKERVEISEIQKNVKLIYNLLTET